MIKYMFDTHMCLHIIEKKPEQVISRILKRELSEIGISTVTLAQLEYGILQSSNPEKNKLALIEFLTPIEVLPFDDMAALEYGKLLHLIDQSETALDEHDLLIAAQAISLNAVLVSTEDHHFALFPSLSVENWTRHMSPKVPRFDATRLSMTFKGRR